MLKFFRKYQKIFFIFITTVTVASFVFFGTYQAFAPSKSAPDETVFHTLDGKGVKSSYLNQLCYFLSEEPVSPFSSRKGMLGNFLNDGVLSKDFLEGGLALPLFEQFQKEIAEELNVKIQREKSYQPYFHPYAKFISAASVWTLFAPEVKENLFRLQKSDLGSSKEAFQTRINLYLAERQFPPSFLAQVLRYQEKETQGLPADPRLFREEISLFGYHNAQDWFTRPFMECVAGFVLNASAFAKQSGYTVTSEEALSDLLIRCEKTYQALKDIPSFPIQSKEELFHHYLKAFHMEEMALVKMWQEVMLFRRLFQDAGGAALIDTHAMKNFFSQAKEYATVEVYQLPAELRLQNLKDLKAFEKYLSAVAPSHDLLDLPSQFEEIEIIERRAPELVGKRYNLEMGILTKKDLHMKVTVKETWNWESADENWPKIQKEFPELAVLQAETPVERIRALEALDNKERIRVDEFARTQIATLHPEWIQEALQHVEMQEKEIFLRVKHATPPFPGIVDVSSFAERLEKENETFAYTQDKEFYFKIRVLKRAPQKEVISFTDAKKENLLESENFDCQALVQALYKDALEQGMVEKGIPEEKLGDQMAPYRFAAYLRKEKEKCEEKGMWKLVKKQETLIRSTPSFIAFDKAIQFSPGVFSDVCVAPKEGAYFFKFLDKKTDSTLPMDKILKAQEVLSTKAKAHFMEEILKKIEEKKAIVLSQHLEKE